MNTNPTEATGHRPEQLEETSFIRYLLASLGTAGIGLGATLLVRRPHRLLIGGGLMVAGAAVLARGIRGQWPRFARGEPTRPYMPAVSTEPEEVEDAWGDNQGEGNRTAARNYNREVRDFVDDGRVTPAARSAARAVDGPEAAALRAAEAKARQSPINRNGNGGSSNGRH